MPISGDKIYYVVDENLDYYNPQAPIDDETVEKAVKIAKTHPRVREIFK